MADWTPTEGDEVVVYRAYGNMVGGRGGASLTSTTVAKVGKRDVVLANGDRFNVRTLSRYNGSWDPPTRLLRADDPLVAKAREANTKANRRARASLAYDAWNRDQTVEGAQELIAAVERWIEVAGDG